MALLVLTMGLDSFLFLFFAIHESMSNAEYVLPATLHRLRGTLAAVQTSRSKSH